MIRHYKITVKGKVQRVSFRFSTHNMALKLGLTGLVRNMPNGDVLIEAEGEEENVNKLIDWCYTGPPKAKVTEVIMEEKDIANYHTFELKR